MNIVELVTDLHELDICNNYAFIILRKQFIEFHWSQIYINLTYVIIMQSLYFENNSLNFIITTVATFCWHLFHVDLGSLLGSLTCPQIIYRLLTLRTPNKKLRARA